MRYRKNAWWYSASVLFLVLGGINWAMLGLVDLNLVTLVFGPGSVMSRIIYIVIGISAVVVAIMHMAAAARPLPDDPLAPGASTVRDRTPPPQ